MSDTSLRTSFLSEITSDDRISEANFEYFEHRLRGRFYDLVTSEFIRLKRAGLLTKAKLARRIGRTPAQVTRWLASPRNLETKTLSRLMLGMGIEPGLHVVHLAQQPPRNYEGSSWIKISEPQPPIGTTDSATSNGAKPSKLEIRELRSYVAA